MAEKWNAKGVWMNSCNCDAGCPCLFWSDPTAGHCDAVDTFHITTGKYGDVKLDGLNVVYATKSPGNMWKGNMWGAVYLDAKANAKQKQALETIFLGKAGGVPEALVKLVGKLAGVKWAKILIDPRKRAVEIPGVLKFTLEVNKGGDKKNAIKVVNHPFAPAIGPMEMGKGTSSSYKDYDVEFANTGKDANWANFTFKGP